MVSNSLYPHDIVISMGAGDISRRLTGIYHAFCKKDRKIVVGVVFGGRSSEHAVSCVSAKNVAACFDPNLYDVKLFGIGKKGHWIVGKDSFERIGEIDTCRPFLSKDVLEELLTCDLCFPVLHGPFGEDGAIQGFFETYGINYVGCDFASSSACMNKAWTKRLALTNGIPTLPFVEVRAFEWKKARERVLENIQKELSFPVFVKPSRLGSSIGVSQAFNETELCSSLDHAFCFDKDLIVEKKVVGQEIEVAVLGNDYIKAAVPGEVLTGGGFYDYEKKYGENSTKTCIPANISFEKQEEVKRLALAVFNAIGCSGLARIDFFLDQQGNYWLNEINPIPGFTSISLYPKMWEKSGLDANRLIDELAILGLHRRSRVNRPLLSFNGI